MRILKKIVLTIATITMVSAEYQAPFAFKCIDHRMGSTSKIMFNILSTNGNELEYGTWRNSSGVSGMWRSNRTKHGSRGRNGDKFVYPIISLYIDGAPFNNPKAWDSQITASKYGLDQTFEGAPNLKFKCHTSIAR